MRTLNSAMDAYPMHSEVKSHDTHFYQTNDGKASFKFGFFWHHRTFEIDVLSISADMDTSFINQELIHTERGTCSPKKKQNKDIPTIAEARKHAEAWAEDVVKKIIHKANSQCIKDKQGFSAKKTSAANEIAQDNGLEMVFSLDAFQDILQTVGVLPPETGGILMGFREDYIVRKFIFDKTGSRWSTGYDPDVDFLNNCLKQEWGKNRYSLLGFLHSHPRGVARLSGDMGKGYGDLGYLKAIFRNIPDLQKFLVPIMFSSHSGNIPKIFPFIATRNRVEDYKTARLRVLEYGSQSIPPLEMANKTFNGVERRQAHVC